MKQTLWIPGKLPTMNQILAARSNGRYAWAKLKKKTEERIGWDIRAQRLRPIKAAWIKFTWMAPNRRTDPDNLVAGRKMVIDALVACKILENDGWNEILGIIDEWKVDKENPGVAVELFDRPPWQEGNET